MESPPQLFWNYIKNKRVDRCRVSPLRVDEPILELALTARTPYKSRGVTKLVLNINPLKATWADAISSRFPKWTAQAISPNPHPPFQGIIDQDTIPEDWTFVSVAPVFKKGDCGKPVNYRPTSLECVCWKTTEHNLHIDIIYTTLKPISSYLTPSMVSDSITPVKYSLSPPSRS